MVNILFLFKQNHIFCNLKFKMDNRYVTFCPMKLNSKNTLNTLKKHIRHVENITFVLLKEIREHMHKY